MARPTLNSQHAHASTASDRVFRRYHVLQNPVKFIDPFGEQIIDLPGGGKAYIVPDSSRNTSGTVTVSARGGAFGVAGVDVAVSPNNVKVKVKAGIGIELKLAAIKNRYKK